MLIAFAIVSLFVFGVLVYFRPGLGFLLSLIFSIAVTTWGLAIEESAIIAVGISVIMLVLPVIAFIGPRRDSNFWLRTWARRILAICGLILFVAVGFLLCGYGGSFGLMVVLLIVGGTSGVIITSELTTAAYVISTIGSSIRQNLPLPMALEMASAGRNDKRAFILRSVKKWLVDGFSLSESLKRGYTRCPGYATALVAVGERIGQVPQAIAAIEQDLVAKVTLNKKVRHIPAFYPPIVLLIIFIIVLFIMTFIMPKFQEVLNEMGEGTQLPAATIILLKIVDFIRRDLGWALGVLLIGGFLIGGAIYVRIKARPRRPEKPYLVSRIGDFIKWHMPFLRWYEWNRAMQRIASTLRLSLNAGCTVNEAIANTLRLDFNGCFKKNLKNWLEKVERGEDIGQSARQCGMGSAMAWAFADLHNHSNTLDILDTLESAYRWGYNRAATLARFIIGPCETICLGLMVGFIVYAVFSALVAIIQTTANSVVP